MKKKILSYIFKYAEIILGAAIYAAGFQFFAYPNSIITGGVAGIAMIINYLSGLPVGILTIIMNIPLFIISWKKFGIGFIIASLVGTLTSAVAVDLFSLIKFTATSQPLLAAIYGGIIQGFGLGLVYLTLSLIHI